MLVVFQAVAQNIGEDFIADSPELCDVVVARLLRREPPPVSSVSVASRMRCFAAPRRARVRVELFRET